MRKRFAILCPILLVAVLAGCSKDEPGQGTPAAGGGSATVAKIPILPDYKYYIGGPTMKRDQYGRYRISKFNGEVEQPPSRGMIFGVKVDGNKLEYRVWGNGRLLALHRGIMRDGLFWQEYAESYRNDKVVARERNVNDDAIKRYKQITEDIDPETGEVIRTKEASISYLPLARIPADDEQPAGADAVESEMLEGDMERDTTPPAAAPKAEPAEPKKP